MRSSITIHIVLFCVVFHGIWAITAADIYARLLEKERNVDNTFAFQFVRPIGQVAGEYIWPRSYSTSSELFFDENGAAYNVRPRPSLHRILQGSRASSLTSQYRYGTYENEFRS